MSRYHSYLNSAVTILSGYKGQEPFAVYLKHFFSSHKKYGSGDRKQIAHLCYCAFRAHAVLASDKAEDRIWKGLLLCSTAEEPLLEQLQPEWSDMVSSTLAEKLDRLAPGKKIQDLFPWKDELSPAVDPVAFAGSLLIQPDLFLRIRPGHRDNVLQKLDLAGIPYTCPETMSLALPNGSRIGEIIQTDLECVVQDLSSQRVGAYLQYLLPHLPLRPAVWDCCAASGGKSLLVRDILGDTDLLVSDLRPSILVNLKKRLAKAGLNNYRSLQADLTDPRFAIPGRFDLVLADLPCSGSGTWGRTPEQLLYFREEEINQYAALQQKIIDKVTTAVKPGGYLLYITCSVFRKENEDMLAYIGQRWKGELVRSGLLTGYAEKADTLFAALFRAPL